MPPLRELLQLLQAAGAAECRTENRERFARRGCGFIRMAEQLGLSSVHQLRFEDRRPCDFADESVNGDRAKEGPGQGRAVR